MECYGNRAIVMSSTVITPSTDISLFELSMALWRRREDLADHSGDRDGLADASGLGASMAGAHLKNEAQDLILALLLP